jgi:hypothetical protein
MQMTIRLKGKSIGGVHLKISGARWLLKIEGDILLED